MLSSYFDRKITNSEVSPLNVYLDSCGFHIRNNDMHVEINERFHFKMLCFPCITYFCLYNLDPSTLFM